MKTILLSCLIMLIPFLSNAQQSETLPVKEPQNYMEKYKKQKKTANVLTITGGALIGSGAIVMLTGYDPDAFIISTQQSIGGAMILSGAVVGLVTVPFYISAGSKGKHSQFSQRFHRELYLFRTAKLTILVLG